MDIRDKIIQSVINKYIERSDTGYKKYGVTLHEDDQPLDTWLKHIQEELMDAVNYIEKTRQVLRSEVEEMYLKDIQLRHEENLQKEAKEERTSSIK
jgi:hypothetical protein